MASQRFVWTTIGFLALAGWTSGLLAAQPQQKQQGNNVERLKALASVLGLDDKQKEQIRKICEEFDEKTRPALQNLWTLCQQEQDALLQVLTSEQRNKVPDVLKEEATKVIDKVGVKLNLNEEQKRKIKEICEKYQPRFMELAKQQEAATAQKFHELGEEVCAEIRPILNEKQRLMLPGILREEFHMWHDPFAQSEQLKVIGDKLGLNDKQREDARRIMAEYQPKMETLHNNLKQLCQDEARAIESILTEQQRTKFREIVKVHTK
jgi:hypothetical protein